MPIYNNDEINKVAEICDLLGNKARLKMLCKLSEQIEATAGELSDASGLTQSAASQHITILKNNDIIQPRRQHNILYYSLKDQKTKKLIEVIYRLYCGY